MSRSATSLVCGDPRMATGECISLMRPQSLRTDYEKSISYLRSRGYRSAKVINTKTGKYLVLFKAERWKVASSSPLPDRRVAVKAEATK